MADPRLLDSAVKPPQHASPQTVAAVAASINSTPFSIHESKRPSLKKDPNTPTDHSPTPSHQSPTTQQTSPSADRAKAASLKRSLLPPAPQPTEDPTTHLPSSPPQIYLNLLILEASLRAQYLTLRARRRQHIFFLLLLSVYLAALGYLVFLRPREDGNGYGGSPYWAIDTAQKVGLLGGAITVCLIWGTGVWERGVRWPRRWVGVTNRGLRVCNLKVVVVRGRWWRRVLEALGMLFPVRALFGGEGRGGSLYAVVDPPGEKRRATGTSHHMSEKEATPPLIPEPPHAYRNPTTHEEDIAPGGDTIKLLLLPKHFSPEFRENWELYRSEYWERENERRAALRKIVKDRERAVRQEMGVWARITGRPGLGRGKDGGKGDVEKSGHGHAHGHHSVKGSKDGHRRRRPSTLSASSHSRSSSRSSVSLPSVPGTPETDNERSRSARGKRMGMTGAAVGASGRSQGMTQGIQGTEQGLGEEKPKGARKTRPSAASSAGSNKSSTIGESRRHARSSPSRRFEVAVKEEEEGEGDLGHTADGETHAALDADPDMPSHSHHADVSREGGRDEENRELNQKTSFMRGVSSSDDGVDADVDDAGSINSERSITSEGKRCQLRS